MIDKRILFLNNYLTKNFKEDNSIENLAKMVNVSPVYLRQLFKAETGCTLIQYKREIRLEKAKQLLDETFLSVKEIAFFIGISNQSKFSQYFKEKFGVSAREYRNWKGKNQNRQ